MTTPVPFIGNGATLTIATVVTLRVKSLDGPTTSVGTVETTALGDTWKTFLPTIADGGEVSGVIYYDPHDVNHTALTALIASPAAVACVLTFKSGSTAAFSGILTELS